MKSRDIDEFTDEDLAYARSIDFSNGLTADEVPFIKAYQEKKGIRKMYAPQKKSITLRLDEDIIAFFKKDGRGYQTRLNAALRQVMYDSLAR
ncbi:MAG: BrnA antitoxin family protein [Neisseriaceae bacterium]|nr:BrnA antitoxin family protein [Neisseriaceae bacterium]